MKYFLTLIGTLLLMTACHKNDDSDFTELTATRAVLIYMSGENNLTVESGIRYLQYDMDEIIEGSKYLTDRQRLFVFVDSLVTNKNKAGRPYIMEVHGGRVYERLKFDEDFYSSDPEKFREIVSWMTENVKADGYGLVLWGHATGWAVDTDTIVSSRRSYGLDTHEDQGPTAGKWMNITQMQEALQGLPKLDFIFCDCCNMMCAEVGYELRNETQYLIGSPAEIPGAGAPYDKIIPQLYKNGPDLYKGIIDTYFDEYLNSYTSNTGLQEYSVPLSVINTDCIEQLAFLTRNVVETFATNYPEQLKLDNLPFYFTFDAPVMYDMQGVIKRFADPATFQHWQQVYRTAVPYSRISKEWMSIYAQQIYAFQTFEQDDDYWGCVSMFVPQYNRSYLGGTYAYNARADHLGWNKIINWSRYGW